MISSHYLLLKGSTMLEETPTYPTAWVFLALMIGVIGLELIWSPI